MTNINSLIDKINRDKKLIDDLLKINSSMFKELYESLYNDLVYIERSFHDEDYNRVINTLIRLRNELMTIYKDFIPMASKKSQEKIAVDINYLIKILNDFLGKYSETSLNSNNLDALLQLIEQCIKVDLLQDFEKDLGKIKKLREQFQPA